MTSLAARGRLRGTAIVVAAAGLAAGLAAAAMVVPLEVVVVGLIAVSGAIAVIASPQVGLVAIAVFTVLRIPEVATEFHGAPSLFLPLLALVALSLLLRRGEIAGASGGVNAAMAVAAFLAVAAISLLAASDAIDTVGTLAALPRMVRSQYWQAFSSAARVRCVASSGRSCSPEVRSVRWQRCSSSSVPSTPPSGDSPSRPCSKSWRRQTPFASPAPSAIPTTSHSGWS